MGTYFLNPILMKRLFTGIFIGISLSASLSVFAFSKSFPDVKISDWFYNDVMQMAEWDVIRGNGDGTFRPENSVNRAELSAMWSRYEDHLEQKFYTKEQVDQMINISSSTVTPSDIESSKTISVGSTGTLNGVSLSVKSIEDYQDDIFDPKEGNRFVSMDLFIENNSGQTIKINAYQFILRDSESYEYNYSVSTKEPQISVGKLEDSKSLRGFLVFEVPQDALLDELKYEVDYGSLGQFYVDIE